MSTSKGKRSNNKLFILMLDFSSDYSPPPTHTLIIKTPKIGLTKNWNFILGSRKRIERKMLTYYNKSIMF